MARYNIPVWSEAELTPRAAEVLRAIVDDSFPEHQITFTLANSHSTDPRVLVFGRVPQGHGVLDKEIIYTYSIPQMMTKANAASVLTASITQYIGETKSVPFGPSDIIRVSAIDRVQLALARIDPDKPVAVDIETSGLLGKTHTPEEVSPISVAFYQEGLPPIVVIGSHIRADGDKFRKVADLVEEQLVVVKFYLKQFTKTIWHNGKFDTRVLNRVLECTLPIWFDTMLAHHVLNHGAGDHKLKTLARRYLGAPEWEHNLGKYTQFGGHYENIPRAELVIYNGMDVYWTYELFKFFEPQIMSDDDNIKAFKFELSIGELLLKVEKTGIPFDESYAKTYAHELALSMEGHLNALQDVTGKVTFNPNSPKQVLAWLQGNFDAHLSKTDAETIAQVKKEAEKAGEKRVVSFCSNLIGYRKAAKVRATYALGWLSKSRNGRVHPTFLVHGTTTGRLSSTGPNAQNVPRDKTIRKLVTLADE